MGSPPRRLRSPGLDEANNPRTRTDYDAVGRKLAETDEAGPSTRYAYDALGRLIRVVLPNPQTGANPPLVNGTSPDAGTLTTTYAYDEVGNRIRQTDAEGRVTRWEFDAMGRETARILPLGQREEKRYNDAGELIESTDFNGVTTRYSYDISGRLETIDYATDADVSTTYTDASERATVTDGRRESGWQYDARGRVLQSIDADGHIIEYQYDDAGKLLARISPSQSLVYEHDALNRITTVTRTVDGEAPSITRYEYDASGNRKAMLGGDGTRTEYGYDARHRLRTLIKTTALGALLVGMSYDVDASGMRTAVEEYDAQGTIRTVEYQYDGVKRLVEEHIDHRDDASDRRTTWTYDKVGNRLTQEVTVGAASAAMTTYTYDNNDRLQTESLSVGTASAAIMTYAYDANGNTTQKQSPDGITTYTYDNANRLIEATTPDATTAYTYNADGLRVRQSVTPAIGPDVGTTTTTWYVQDAGYAYAQVIEQYQSVGAGQRQLTATFTFADDLVSQTRYDEQANPSTAFVQMDGFGSTRWVTDQAGSITDSMDYDAFGVEIGRSGSTDIEHLYRGEAFDPNVGFYYLRARWMDQETGRFATQDTYMGNGADPVTLHKYLYANVDPVNVVDPSGNFGFLSVSVGGLAQSSFRGFRLGGAVSFVGKTGAEIAFEMATGIPVITSPRSLIGAVRSGANVTGKLATKFWLSMFKAGNDFEQEGLKFLLRLGYKKNTKRFANGEIATGNSGYFIPDVYVKGSKLLDFKTSFGAVKKEQFQEFIRIANQELGLKVSLVMLRKPTPSEVAVMERWAKEVSTKTDEKDILFSIIHLLD